MATNERMSLVNQTATMKGDKHMNTNGQTATIVASPKRTKRIVSANQRRAEIVIAALFVLTAATSIPAAFVLDPMLNAPTIWPGFSQPGSSRIGYPAVVVQQHWDCLHRGVCASLAQKTR